MKPKIIITFDRKEKRHSVETKEVTGMEILLAIQSLTEHVEKETGMPLSRAMKLAFEEQEK